MQYDEILKYISSLNRFGMKPGLQRMQALMQHCGNPHKSCKYFHIAGTNGKGSVSAMIYNILLNAGIKAGLYISPFILDFRERIQINGEMISKQLLSSAFDRISGGIQPLIDAGDCPTEFEIVTAMAFAAYEMSGCEAVVLETGLGGRLDSTNIIDAPLCSVITPVSYDHTAVLGDTIEKIAFEKSGIIKPGCPVVAAPQEYAGAMPVIRAACGERGCALCEVHAGDIQITHQDIFGSDMTYRGMNIHVPLSGTYQPLNAATAAAAVMQQRYFDISAREIADGIASVKFPARFEIIAGDPLLILDGGHNPAAFKALCESMRRFVPGGFDMIIGMTAEKDYETSISMIAPLCRNITVTSAVHSRTPALTPEALAAVCRKYCKNVSVVPDHAHLVPIIAMRDIPLLVCGSLYLAAELRPLLIECAGESRNS